MAQVMPLSVQDQDFRGFFEANADFVWRTLGLLGVPDADRPDCAQKVFLVAYQKRDLLRHGVSARSWLYGIARRVAADLRRRGHVKRERPFEAVREMPHASVGPEAAAATSERVALLRRIITTLDAEKRDALVLFDVEGLPMQQVAKMMGCPLKTAYGRLYAARREVAARFREALGEEGCHGG